MQGRTNVKDGIFLNSNVEEMVVTGNRITAGDFVELTGDTTQLEKIIDANYTYREKVDISDSVRCFILYDSTNEILRFVFFGFSGIVKDVSLSDQVLGVGNVSFENGYIYIANNPTLTGSSTSLDVNIKKYSVDNSYNVAYVDTIALDSTCFDAVISDIGSITYAYPWGVYVNQGKIIFSVRYNVLSQTANTVVYCANIDGSFNKKIGLSTSNKWVSRAVNNTNKYVIYSNIESAFVVDASALTLVNELKWDTTRVVYAMQSCVIKYDPTNNVFVNACLVRTRQAGSSPDNPYVGIQVTIHNGNNFNRILGESFINADSSFTDNTTFNTGLRDILFTVSGTKFYIFVEFWRRATNPSKTDFHICYTTYDVSGNTFSDSSYAIVDDLVVNTCLMIRQLNDINTYLHIGTEIDLLSANIRNGYVSVVDEYTLVKPYENRIDGVAKQSGDPGDTIEVYTPIQVA